MWIWWEPGQSQPDDQRGRWAMDCPSWQSGGPRGVAFIHHRVARSISKRMNGTTFGTISETINILLVLLVTSYLFDQQITKAGTRAEGHTWQLVVIGVFYTQCAIGLLDLILNWNAFFIGMLAYSVSGFPMIYGAYARNKEMQKRADKALKE
jgi:heme A synthase